MNHLTNITLKIWRQNGPVESGRFETHVIPEISADASFLEMLDVLNEGLIATGEDAVVFDSDCREGICGTCSLMINGIAHGPQRATTACQLHMRTFKSNDTIVIEPWRASAFPIIKDLMVDRSAFDRIIEVGGFITAPTGGAPEANLIPVPKPVADASMDSAQQVVAPALRRVQMAPEFIHWCPAHLNLLPRAVERFKRTEAMVETMTNVSPARTMVSVRLPAPRNFAGCDCIDEQDLQAKIKNRKN